MPNQTRPRLTTKGSEGKLSGLTVFLDEITMGGWTAINESNSRNVLNDSFLGTPPIKNLPASQAKSKSNLRPYAAPWIAPAPPHSRTLFSRHRSDYF